MAHGALCCPHPALIPGSASRADHKPVPASLGKQEPLGAAVGRGKEGKCAGGTRAGAPEQPSSAPCASLSLSLSVSLLCLGSHRGKFLSSGVLAIQDGRGAQELLAPASVVPERSTDG